MASVTPSMTASDDRVAYWSRSLRPGASRARMVGCSGRARRWPGLVRPSGPAGGRCGRLGPEIDAGDVLARAECLGGGNECDPGLPRLWLAADGVDGGRVEEALAVVAGELGWLLEDLLLARKTA